MNKKLLAFEDISDICVKNRKSMESIIEKVSRMNKLTLLDAADFNDTLTTRQKSLKEGKLMPSNLSVPIQDAYDILEPEITSLKGKSILNYIKYNHLKLCDYSLALEGYIKYRNEPYNSPFSTGSRLPMPQRLIIHNQYVELFAIGQNDDGQLGLPRENFLATTKFRKPNGVENVNLLASGSMHSVVVDSSGSLYTFGFEDCIGSRDGRDDDICPIPLSVKVLQISCGEYFTAFIDNNGEVWYFGGFRDKLGERLYYEKSPKKVQLNIPVVKIASGESHLLILCQDMSCYVLGVAEFGQGTIPTTSSVPVKLYLQEPVFDIYASGFTSFFMTPTGLFSCGNNGFGESGIGHYRQAFHPQAVMFPKHIHIIDISGGMHHTLFLDSNGHLWASGKNFDGQLGLNSDISIANSPIKVEICGARYPIRKIAAGTSSHHSYCIDADGSLFCAGQNEYNQLGIDGDTIFAFQKVDLKKRKAVQVAGGCQFTILALTDRLS